MSSVNNMFAREFTLRQYEILKIKKELHRIRLLFPNISIRFEKTDNESRSKILWVTINGPSEEICEAAKKYMTALTSENTQINIGLPQGVTQELLQNGCQILRNIESQNSVVIDLDIATQNISIQGDELEVVLARSLIDEQIEKFNRKVTNDYEINKVVTSLKEITIDNNVKNFALKLGYNETNIQAAANSCIDNQIELNEDNILKELTKQCPQNSQDCRNVSEICSEEDFVAKTVAEYTAEQLTGNNSNLRGIVIDGSNVAMCHGHKQIFSCIGIEIVVNWFKQRGHNNIKVFVPQWRQETPKSDCPMKNQEILNKLEMEKILVFTPSRRVNGRRIVCYDDRYIVKYAVETDSIIVSNDQFRDLQKENSKWKQYLDQHILMYSFVNDMFMPPDDPLGRSGPNLDEFLKTGSYQAKVCPYKNKCTYGSKCRYFHPDNYDNNFPEKASTSNFNMNQRCHINKEKERYLNRQPFMSCAAEMNALEQHQQFQLYDHDIIARGRSAVSDNFSNGDQQQMMRDWHPPKHQQAQVYPSYSQPQQYQFQQQPNIPQQKCPSQNQHFYSVPPNNPSAQWNQYTPPMQTFTLQPRNTPTQPLPPQNQYYMSMHPSASNSYQPTTPRVNMMNGAFVNQGSMNNPYYQSSHTLQPLESSNRNLAYRKPADQVSQIETSRLFNSLMDMFPGHSLTVRKVLQEHPHERDMNLLVSHVLNEQTQ